MRVKVIISSFKMLFYVPYVKQRLFCPQQWAQYRNNNNPKPRGTYIIQDDKHLDLHWDHNEYTNTIPLDRHTNTVFMRTIPSFYQLFLFHKQLKQKINQHEMEKAYLCNVAHTSNLDNIIKVNLKFQNPKNESTIHWNNSNIHKIQNEERITSHANSLQCE